MNYYHRKHRSDRNILSYFEGQRVQQMEPILSPAGFTYSPVSPNINNSYGIVPVQQVTTQISTQYSYNYYKNGINVRITGSEDDINKVNQILNNHFNPQNGGHYGLRYFPISPNIAPIATSVQLYDSSDGRPGPVINLDPMRLATINYNYNANGINVTLTGTQEDIIKVKEILDKKLVDEKKVATTVATTVVSIDDRKFYGSGVMIFERDINSEGRNILNVLLVGNPGENIYNDFGGFLSSVINNENNVLELNAKSQLKKNSAILFDFDNVKLTRDIEEEKAYIDIINDDGKYFRCYLICLDKKYRDVSDGIIKNQLIINPYNPFGIREMNKIIRIKICDNLKKYLNNSVTHKCTDENGDEKTLSDRAKKILIEFIANRSLFGKLGLNPSKSYPTSNLTYGGLSTIKIQ